MPLETTNLKLKKPLQEEFYDVDVANKNLDKIDEAIGGKVTKVDGKGLSSNDFTTEEKEKLAGLENYDDTGIKKQLSNKSDKSSLFNCPLLTAKWQGTKPPYTYKFQNEQITETSNQELLPSDTITDKELSALQSANLTDIGQGEGYFMLQANGAKPKIDIPIRLIFRGDM